MSSAAITMEEKLNDQPLIQLPKGKRLLFFSILYLLFVFDLAIRYGVNAILPLIQGDLGISDTQIGILSSCVFLGMAFFVLPISYWGEKNSQKKAITMCTLIWSAVTIICGFAQSAVLLALARFGVGAGNSAYAALSTAMITSWYQKSSWGKMLGMYNTAMVLGGALGYVAFAGLAETIGWRATFYVVGGISLVLSFLTLLLPDNKKVMAEAAALQPQEEKAAEVKLNIKDTIKLVTGNKALLTMCLGAGLAVMVLNAITTYLSIYYVRVMELSITVAAGIVAISTPINILAYPLGGAVLDRWYKKDKRARIWMPMICILLAAVSFAIGFASASIPFIIFGNLFYALGNTSFHTASHELVPSWYKSISYGTYVLFIQLLGAAGPILAGVLSDALGITQALLGLQIAFGLSAMVLLYSGGQYLKYYNQAREAEKAAGLSE